MGIIFKVKEATTNIKDSVSHKLRHRNVMSKFKDSRRVEIYHSVQLTKEQEDEIDELFLKNYGEKVPHIWHRHSMAFTGNYDKNYFPELLYIPEFEQYMNRHGEYVSVFCDKNVLPSIAKSAGIKMPETVISCTKGIYRDGDNHMISCEKAKEILGNYGYAFLKPSTDSCSGRGCMLLKMKDGTDISSGLKVDELLEKQGNDFVIQKRLSCHESIAAIHPDSVNTFRVITYIWKDEIISMPVIMRIGQGGNHVDNAHAGGMFIAVDDDGTLHDQAFTEFRNIFTVHPDTKIRFGGYQIELFPKILSAAYRMHELVPQIGVVNWDFTLDSDGEPILIEANINGGSVWLPQIAHGKGAFGEKTEEVLRWISFMKKMKATERRKYSFGKMEK